MNINHRFDKLENKLDNIDQKLDNHLERLAKAETDVSWISGHLKIVTGFVLTIMAGAITYYITSN